MKNYIDWLNNADNCGYFILTWFLLGTIVFIIVYTGMFISETIEKNKKVEELEEELKKLKEKENEQRKRNKSI